MLLRGKSKKQIIDYISKMFKVKYRLVKKSIDWGYAEVDVFNEIIYINMNLNKTKNEFVSSLLHEICHIIASRQGKYEVYHKDKISNDKNRRIFLKTALRAELYVEKQAQYLMKMFFPGMKYVKSYNKKEDIEWFNNTMLENIRKKIKKTKIKNRLKDKKESDFFKKATPDNFDIPREPEVLEPNEEKNLYNDEFV